MRRCNAHDAPLVIRELRACENLAYYIQTFIYIHLLPMRKEKKEGSIYQKTCSYRNWKCFQLSFLFSRTLKKRKRNSFHKILLIAIFYTEIISFFENSTKLLLSVLQVSPVLNGVWFFRLFLHLFQSNTTFLTTNKNNFDFCSVENITS